HHHLQATQSARLLDPLIVFTTVLAGRLNVHLTLSPRYRPNRHCATSCPRIKLSIALFFSHRQDRALVPAVICYRQSCGGPMPQPVNSSPQPDPNEKLVKIFDTEQETEAIVVRGLLESAGIDSDLKSIDAVQDAFPGVGGTVILVREQDAPEAKRII